MLHLKDFINKICIPSENVITCRQAYDTIVSKYGYDMGIICTSKLIRKHTSVKQTSIRVNGAPCRVFLMDIIDIDITDISININNVVSYDSEAIIKAKSERLRQAELTHRIIRFIIRDWEMIDLILQLKYRKYKDQYFKEIIAGIEPNSKWFDEIIQESKADYGHINTWMDFEIRSSREMFYDLRRLGVIRTKRFFWDKLDTKLSELGYQRLSDHVYGKTIKSNINNY